jgi:hypothetical protein
MTVRNRNRVKGPGLEWRDLSINRRLWVTRPVNNPENPLKLLLYPCEAADDVVKRIIDVVSGEFSVRICRTPDLSAPRPVPWCALLVEQALSYVTAERVTKIRNSHPLVPLVIVAPRTRFESSVPPANVDGIVWIDEVDRRLPNETRRVRAAGVRALVRVAATLLPNLAPLARKAIQEAASRSSSFASVSELAAALGVSRSTLWRAWVSVGTDHRRLKDLLDWLRLTEAVSRKNVLTSWSDVAVGLETHEHSLARIAFRLTGRSLHGLATSPGFVLSDDFVRETAASLFASPVLNEFF